MNHPLLRNLKNKDYLNSSKLKVTNLYFFIIFLKLRIKPLEFLYCFLVYKIHKPVHKKHLTKNYVNLDLQISLTRIL